MEYDVFTYFSEELNFLAFKDGVDNILSKPIKSLIILSCSGNNYPEDEVNNLLSTIDIPVCGGTFPNIFYENNLLSSGVIFIGLSFEVSIELFSDLQENVDEVALAASIEKRERLVSAKDILMFYDGLMANVEGFVEELHGTTYNPLTILGGGSGNLDFIERPCVYTNEGIKADTIQLVVLPKSLSIATGHGWEVFEGPFLVSESTGANIESLNYQGAFSLYQKIVEKLSDYKFSKHDFFDIAKHFPFGIESMQGDLLVRDPIVVNGEIITCVGNIPRNSMVYILKGDKQQLIGSAAKAAKKMNNENECSMAIIFDCISRKLYLEDDFTQELNLLISNNKMKYSFGVLSLGEVANNEAGTIKLLNKSTVIGCL